MTYETIIYEVDAADRRRDHHAQPAGGAQRVQSHDVPRDPRRVASHQGRQRCQRRGVPRRGRPRILAPGLDVREPYGQPDDVWNHEDPGELLSPKWQKVWKPVVCAVQGICTAGALYFLNESDIVICSHDATFFDSHVTFGLVSAIEPVGLMRRVGLAETLRIALSGNDERVSADTALRISLVTEVVDRAQLWDRAHEIARAIAEKPTAATQGTVRAIWESLDKPYRAAVEQGLAYTRIGNPIGSAEVDRSSMAPITPRIR